VSTSPRRKSSQHLKHDCLHGNWDGSWSHPLTAIRSYYLHLSQTGIGSHYFQGRVVIWLPTFSIIIGPPQYLATHQPSESARHVGHLSTSPELSKSIMHLFYPSLSGRVLTMYDGKLTSDTSRMCFQIVGMHSFSLPFEIDIYHILQSVSGKLDIDPQSKINSTFCERTRMGRQIQRYCVRIKQAWGACGNAPEQT
jgi:hypothetical protein